VLLKVKGSGPVRGGKNAWYVARRKNDFYGKRKDPNVQKEEPKYIKRRQKKKEKKKKKKRNRGEMTRKNISFGGMFAGGGRERRRVLVSIEGNQATKMGSIWSTGGEIHL